MAPEIVKLQKRIGVLEARKRSQGSEDGHEEGNGVNRQGLLSLSCVVLIQFGMLCMCAAGRSKEIAADGIVDGHAYSVISAKDVTGKGHEAIPVPRWHPSSTLKKTKKKPRRHPLFAAQMTSPK